MECFQQLSLPWTATPYLPEGQEYDSRVAQILVNEHPTIRQAINLRLASNWITHHSIQDYLRSLNLQDPPTQLCGVDYTSFPPTSFHTKRTYSWLYMPLILQAANQGRPIINIAIPEQHSERWRGWLHTLASHPDFLQLGQIFSHFDQPFHLPANDQNTTSALPPAN